MIFITTAFGKEYIQLNLPSYLGSLIETHLDSEVHIFIDEASIADQSISNCIEKAKSRSLKVNAYSLDNFGRQLVNEKEKSKVAATKVKLWHEALKHIVTGEANDNVCITDLDVIFLKNLGSCVQKEFLDSSISNGCLFTFYDSGHKAFDSAAHFTTSCGNRRINSGVMFFTTVGAGIEMTKKWLSITSDILDHGSPLNLEYMAEDQDALVLLYSPNLLQRKNFLSSFFSRKSRLSLDFSATIILNGMQMAGVPCRKYNEPESIGRIPEYTKVVHFKSGWQNIIKQVSLGLELDEISYSTGRPKAACTEQLEEWKKFRKLLTSGEE